MTPEVRLLGLRFAALDEDGALDWLLRRPAEAPFGYVVTPNADHLTRLSCRPDLRPLYDGAALRLLDSRVVAALARGLGLPTPPVVTGSDLTARLARVLDEPVTVIGLNTALAPRPPFRAMAHYDPPRGFIDQPREVARAVDFVLAHKARFTFLAVGSPRQEQLAAAIAATGRGRGLGLCIGASLEFLIGAKPRAPLWMRRAGLEWLHRLAGDPAGLGRRYLWDCPAIVPLLIRDKFGSSRPSTS